MRFIIVIFLVSIIGLVTNPVFVYAGSDCFVDADVESGGDGTKGDPYTKISKAIDENCKNINVKSGTYKDNITLEKGVEIDGSGRSKTIVTGKITMKDGTELEDVGLRGGGIKISDGADVKITDVAIKNANIGIETTGGGKLLVKKTKISGNRKGLYLQKGKNITITDSEISNNLEEGIDIRSNVDGLISGNIIEENGESGIELILGKSNLIISNNKIKHNRSSGIATQFYSHAEKLGDVRISNNTISGNKDFAINCKIPSGGNPSVGYWTNSITLIGNNIYGNKDGDFALNCKFKNLKITNATKTEDELEAEKKAKEEALLVQQQEEEKKELIITQEADRVDNDNELSQEKVLKKELPVSEENSIVNQENDKKSFGIINVVAIASGILGITTVSFFTFYPILDFLGNPSVYEIFDFLVRQGK